MQPFRTVFEILRFKGIGVTTLTFWGRVTSSVTCSEISCNVKLNVYLAMEIPDHVSFVSGQNSDEIVRSCELS